MSIFEMANYGQKKPLKLAYPLVIDDELEPNDIQ